MYINMANKCSNIDINKIVEERLRALHNNEAFMQKIVNERIKEMMERGALTAQQEFAFLQQLRQQGVQPNQFNAMFKLLQQKILQNENSINKREAEILRKQWQDYISLQKQIPEIIDKKEETYYTFTEKVGLNPPGTYYNVLKTRYTKQAKNTRHDEDIEIDDFRRMVNVMLNDYTGLTNSANKIKELLNQRIEQKKTLEEEIDIFIKTVNTNERKIFYELKAEDWLKIYKNIIFAFYYITIIYYLIFGSFFSFKSIKGWIIIIIFITLPFYLMNLIHLFFNFYDYLKDIINRRRPRNVYTELNNIKYEL